MKPVKLIAIICTFILSCNKLEERLVHEKYFQFKADSAFHVADYGFIICNSKIDFDKVIHDFGFSVNVNFNDNNRYIISFGSQIDDLKVDYDAYKKCPFLKDYDGVPLKIKFSDTSKDSIYIYKISSRKNLLSPCE